MKPGPLFTKCRNPSCQAIIEDGEYFCDPLCMEEYENSKCIQCGEIKESSHTITEPEGLLGRKICYDCFEERRSVKVE